MSRSSTRRPEKSRTDPPKPAAARPQPQRVAPPGALQRALSDPATASPDQIRTMQHSLGNRAVSRLLTGGARGKPGARKPVIQPKLTVGPASDSYEQEADRVAADVMRRPAPAAPGAVLPGEETDRGITPPVQREAEAPEQMIQAQPAGPQVGLEGGEAGPEVESRLGASRGAGNPLPDGIRSFMEPRFGADFSGVRVHTGSESAQLNRQLSAQAFTHGSDIYMGEGKYNPGAQAGQQLLAHELTHVVQQGGARANKVQAKLTAGPAGDQYEPEADRVAAQATAPPGTAALARRQPTASLTVQRKMNFKPADLQGNLSKTAKLGRMLGKESTFSKIQKVLGAYHATMDAVEEASLLAMLAVLSYEWLQQHDKGPHASAANPKVASVRRLLQAAQAETPGAQQRKVEAEKQEKARKQAPKLGLGFGNLYEGVEDAFGRKGAVKGNLGEFAKRGQFKGLSDVDVEKGKLVMTTLDKHPIYGDLWNAANKKTSKDKWYSDFAATQDKAALDALVEDLRKLSDAVGPMNLSDISGIYLMDLQIIMGVQFEGVREESGKFHSPLHMSTLNAMRNASEIGSNLAGFTSLMIKWAKGHSPAKITDEEAAATGAVTSEKERQSTVSKTTTMAQGKTYANDDVCVWNRMDLVEGKGITPWPSEVTLVSVWELATIYHTPELLKKTKFYNYRTTDAKMNPISIGKVGGKGRK